MHPKETRDDSSDPRRSEQDRFKSIVVINVLSCEVNLNTDGVILFKFCMGSVCCRGVLVQLDIGIDIYILYCGYIGSWLHI